ncbi:MAG: hypothetical protein I4O49_16240 [Janthinobacterium lividum]|nr:hypothetical protein [Janthinobacterium lividum]
MSIRTDSTSVRRSAGVAWVVGLAATITGVVLYAVSIARVMTVTEQLKSVCDRNALGDRTRTLGSIEQYHQPVMVLAAVGVAAAVVAFGSSRRSSVRVLAAVVAVTAAILFLLGWYAFAHQSENVGPFCGG